MCDADRKRDEAGQSDVRLDPMSLQPWSNHSAAPGGIKEPLSWSVSHRRISVATNTTGDPEGDQTREP